MPETSRTFTGRKRTRRTHWRVRWADRAARLVITLGGVGTIGAVTLMSVFLVWVAIPLFESPSVETPARSTLNHRSDSAVYLMTDESCRMSLTVYRKGQAVIRRLSNGKILQTLDLTQNLAKGEQITAWSVHAGHFAFGTNHGRVQFGALDFIRKFFEAADVPPRIGALKVGKDASYKNGIITRTPAGQFRLQQIQLTLDTMIADPENTSPILLIDHTYLDKAPLYTTLNAQGRLNLYLTRRQENWMTGKVTLKLTQGKLPYHPFKNKPAPRFLKMTELGDSVFLAWDDGTLLRYDSRNPTKAVLAETIQLTQPGIHLTALQMLNGGTTLIAGHENGALSAWFPIKPPHASTSDGAILTRGHILPKGPDAVVALAISARSRMLGVGFEGGQVGLYHVSTEQQLIQLQLNTTPQTQRHSAMVVAIAPKDNGLAAENASQLAFWKMDPKYPAINLSSLFLPVWYEGALKPSHVWQSSSGTDDFEPKFGMIPLVFGTLKATFYSMLFGLPIAMLAAIYSSEFLHKRVKAWVKPTIELMASLPSVVLGFLAALVFAPFFEKYISAMLTAFVMVPLFFLLGAYLWQLLPQSAKIPMENLGLTLPNMARRSHLTRGIQSSLFYMGGVRLLSLLVLFFAAIWAAVYLAPWVESALFAGNVKQWLNGQIGTGTGAWLILLLPLSAVGAFYVTHRWINRWMVAYCQKHNIQKIAGLDLIKFCLVTVITLTFAWALAMLFNHWGWDPRGTYVDTYVQRNALIVGFVMGFAVIPVIYTLAEDALSAVPEHLRSASLATGATSWQTAVRIIVPTAMSGLFSAMMIGLGRAVGETMIVLMAAGNTPVLEMNVFNGFRTLAANIAVELPEAPINGTHYRTLFLAALTLFAITFVVNTLAEVVRLRFRKKAVQL